jgi:hypothetical protein
MEGHRRLISVLGWDDKASEGRNKRKEHDDDEQQPTVHTVGMNSRERSAVWYDICDVEAEDVNGVRWRIEDDGIWTTIRCGGA